MLALTLPLGQRWTMLVLLAAWAALLFGGFAFGQISADRQRRMPAWTRLASSGLLVLAGWAWFFFSRGQAAPLPLLIAIGMSLGGVGDLFMAGWLPAANRVIAGIAAFGLGHLAYIAAVWLYSNRHGLVSPAPRAGAWLVWLFIGVAAWYLVVYRGRRHTTLQLAALPYALLLASTTGLAWGLALQASAFLPLAFGAALFLASDLLLAARLFSGLRFYLSDDWVWLMYGPGQMLIVYAIAMAE